MFFCYKKKQGFTPLRNKSRFAAAYVYRFKPYSRVVAYISPVLMDRRFRYSGQISSYGMRQICSYFVHSVNELRSIQRRYC